MKKQIAFIAFIAILSLALQNSYAVYNSNIECDDSDWKSCVGGSNVQICDKDGWQNYRCPGGTYGAPTTCHTSCSKCPMADTWPVLSKEGNNDKITSCYIFPSITYTDTTGTFKVTANCYYKE